MRIRRPKLYAIARHVFWLLPAALRDRLHGIRHLLVRRFRSRLGRGVPTDDCIDWPVFRDRIISCCDYRQVLIYEANVDWDIMLFQRPHHMALAMGRLGCLVIFRTMGDSVVGFRRVAENVWLANDSAVDSIPAAARCFYSTSLLAIGDDMRVASERGVVVYEYIDHIDSSISGGVSSLRRLEELKRLAFSGVADLVIASASILYEEALSQCKHTHCSLVPNGVDVSHFRNLGQLSDALPDTLLSLRKQYGRIIGYFGAIAPWLWYEVIDEVSARMPDTGFVFIGPDYSGCVPRLPQRQNFLYLGAADYRILPAYACLFDVCFIPFRPGDLARSTSPLKLFEYFALEKPVVVTSEMKECVAFPEVFSGSNTLDLIEAMESAFAVCKEPTFTERLRILANDNSWDIRAEVYLKALTACMENDL